MKEATNGAEWAVLGGVGELLARLSGPVGVAVPGDAEAVLAASTVRRAACVAWRAGALRRGYAAMRAEGVPSREAFERLTGPWTDEEGRAYWLSVDRVRAVVYAGAGGRGTGEGLGRVDI